MSTSLNNSSHPHYIRNGRHRKILFFQSVPGKFQSRRRARAPPPAQGPWPGNRAVWRWDGWTGALRTSGECPERGGAAGRRQHQSKQLVSLSLYTEWPPPEDSVLSISSREISIPAAGTRTTPGIEI